MVVNTKLQIVIQKLRNAGETAPAKHVPKKTRVADFWRGVHYALDYLEDELGSQDR